LTCAYARLRGPWTPVCWVRGAPSAELPPGTSAGNACYLFGLWGVPSTSGTVDDHITHPNLNGKLVLVAEDELIIAADYYFELKRAGATAVGFSATNDAALDYLAHHDVDAAIVDYMLQEGTGERLIHYLDDHRIPFIVVSGCAEQIRGRVLAARILEKPVTGTDVRRALSQALDSRAFDSA
jgi:CheY-like chemotaxis protein